MITPELTPRLLVTGGAGFIGAHLVGCLIEKGFSVIVLDNLQTGNKENLHRDVKFISGDVRDEKLVKSISVSVDAVFHLAGVVGMRLAHQAAEESYDISSKGTELLLRNIKVPIVLFSSSAVYGFSDNRASTEKHIISKDDIIKYDGGKKGYASGKFKMENLGKTYSSNQPLIIIRPFNVIGPGQKGAYGMVVPRFINYATHNQPLTVYDDGQQRRSFSDVFTFNNCLLSLVASEAAWNAKSNTFNIGNPNDNSIIELVEVIAKLTEKNLSVDFVPYEKIFPNKSDVRSRKPNISHLQSIIGHVEWPSITQIIRTILKD